MANTLKKLLSLVIALVMVLSMIPAVSAAETTETESETTTDATGTTAATESSTEEDDGIVWNEIANEEEWDAWFSGYNKSKLLTEHGDGQPVYLKLTESFEITCEKLQYIGHNTGSICCKVIIDLGGNTLTYNKAESATLATRFMGIYGSADSHLTIQNGTLINNGEYDGAGGGVFLLNKGGIKLENLTITDNSSNAYSSSGKILSVSAGYTAELINVTINVNSANSTGNAGAINNSGTLIMTGCTLNGSETSSNVKGGLVYVGAGNATFTNCTFNGGQAEMGGQVYASNTVTMSGCTFNGGKAEYGAQLYITSTSGTTLTNCQFNGGEAPFGTVAIAGKSTVTMEGGYIANGVAESYTTTTTDADGVTTSTTTKAKGGNLWIYNESNKTAGSVVTLTGVTVKDGVCDNIGGNIYLSNKNGYAAPQVTLNNCTVSGGEGKNGGSIGMTGGAQLTVNGGTISGGAGNNGGLIWSYNDTEADDSSVLTLNGVTLSGGTATNGAAVYVQTYKEKAPCTAVITDCTIKDCVAKGYGGAVYVANGPVEESVTITNTNISGCSAAHGGAVALRGKGTVGIYGGTISECAATGGNGGAIYAYNNDKANTASAKLTLDGLTVQNCTATEYGGGIYASSVAGGLPGEIVAENVILDGNKATEAGFFGGNVYFAGAAYTDAETGVATKLQVSFTDSVIKNGEAESFGGNIGMAGSAQVTLTGCTVENGKSLSVADPTKGGGGNLYMGNSNAVLTLNDTDFIGGEAALYGGNIRIGSGQIIIDQGSSVSGGVAGKDGHTIQMNDNAASNIYLYDGVIEATVIETLTEEAPETDTEEEIVIPEGIKLNGAGNICLINGTVSGFDANAYTVYGKSYAVANEDGTYTVKHYAVDGATTKTGSCEEAGTVTIECAECARTFVYEEAAAGHAIVIDKAVAPTCTETGLTEGQHCALCDQATVAQEEVAATGHAADEAVKENVVEHTCTTDGSYDSVVYCATCKVELSREVGVVDPAAHTEQVVEGKAATCTEDGLTEGKICSVCQEVLVAQETIPAAHTEQVVEGKAATCTETGLTEGKVCSVCGETLVAQEEIPAAGHSIVVDEAVAPGCETTGLTEGQHCQNCDDATVAQEEVPAAGHAWDEGVLTEATKEADAFTTYTCATCGATKVEVHEGTQLPTIEAAITQQPVDVNAETGSQVQFTVAAQGEVVSYKWEYRKVFKWFDTYMTGYNTDTLTVTATGARHKYDYRCLITFADGTEIYSEPAELTVNTYITNIQSPNDQTVVLGYKGQFSAEADGESVKYQWYYKRPDGTQWWETTMEGSTQATVMIETTTARDGYQYRCKITDVAGVEVYTEPATMRVLSFTSHPEEVFTPTGGTAKFTVGTSVPDGFTYQWQYRSSETGTWNNTSMTGYNTATLSVNATLARNGYQYRCVLTGSKQSKIESKAATLHVGNPVEITAQPADVTGAVDTNAVFTVEATNAYAYQWQYRRSETGSWQTTSAEGNQTAQLTVGIISTRNGYQYRCVIQGLDGITYYTDPATLTVG